MIAVQVSQLPADLVRAACDAAHKVACRRKAMRGVGLVTNDLRIFNDALPADRKWSPATTGGLWGKRRNMLVIWLNPQLSPEQAVVTLAHELAHNYTLDAHHTAKFRTMFARLLPVVAAQFMHYLRPNFHAALKSAVARYYNAKRSPLLRDAVFADEHSRDSAYLWAQASEVNRLYNELQASARRHVPQIYNTWGWF